MRYAVVYKGSCKGGSRMVKKKLVAALIAGVCFCGGGQVLTHQHLEV